MRHPRDGDEMLDNVTENGVRDVLDESMKEGNGSREIPDFLQATDDVGEPDLSNLQVEEDLLEDPFEF